MEVNGAQRLHYVYKMLILVAAKSVPLSVEHMQELVFTLKVVVDPIQRCRVSFSLLTFKEDGPPFPSVQFKYFSDSMF